MSCSPRVGFQTPIRRSRERERGEMSEQDIPSPAGKLNQQKHFKKEKKRLFKLHLGPQPVFELPFISFYQVFRLLTM